MTERVHLGGLSLPSWFRSSSLCDAAVAMASTMSGMLLSLTYSSMQSTSSCLASHWPRKDICSKQRRLQHPVLALSFVHCRAVIISMSAAQDIHRQAWHSAACCALHVHERKARWASEEAHEFMASQQRHRHDCSIQVLVPVCMQLEH